VYINNSNEYVEFSMVEDSPKVQATKRRITNCLFDHLVVEPIERITVSQLCIWAHINRSTFYNHFIDIYDVRDRCVEEIASAVGEALPQMMRSILVDSDVAAMEGFMQRLEPYADYLNVLFNSDPAFLVRLRGIAHESLKTILGGDHLSEKQEYLFNAMAGMQFGVIGYWFATKRSLSLGDLADFMRALIWQGPRSVLRESFL
jgi:AcrR family transcriptional regulator